MSSTPKNSPERYMWNKMPRKYLGSGKKADTPETPSANPILGEDVPEDELRDARDEGDDWRATMVQEAVREAGRRRDDLVDLMGKDKRGAEPKKAA